MGKKSADKSAQKASTRCPVSGCKFKLIGDNRVSCNNCERFYCSSHQFPGDHDCVNIDRNPKDNAVPNSGGIVFVGNSASKTNGVKNITVQKQNPSQTNQLIEKVAATQPEVAFEEICEFAEMDIIRYPLTTTALAMVSDDKTVRSTLLSSVVPAMLTFSFESNNMDKLELLLKKQLDSLSRNQSESDIKERSNISMITLYSRLKEFQDSKNGTNLQDRLRFGLNLATKVSEKVGKSLANELIRRVVRRMIRQAHDNRKDAYSSVQPDIIRFCRSALEAKEDDDCFRSTAAYTIGVICNVFGASVTAQDISSLAFQYLKQRKNGPVKSAARILHQLNNNLGLLLIPYLFRNEDFYTVVLDVYDKSTQSSRRAVKSMLCALMDKIDDYGAKVSIPFFAQGLISPSWRIKTVSLELLIILGKRKLRQMFRQLPSLVPLVMECVKETKKQVSEAAESLLDTIGSMMVDAETTKLLPWILPALKNPAEVEKCLDELMDTTFANNINPQSLSLIVPVVLRSLREGSTEMKLKGTIATGNICSLVADVNDIRPFFSSLMPELRKLADHYSPRVREQADIAIQSLQQDMVLSRRSSSIVVDDGHESLRVAGSPDISFDSFKNDLRNALVTSNEYVETHIILDYVLGATQMIVSDLIDDTDENMPRNLVKKAVNEFVLQIVASFDAIFRETTVYVDIMSKHVMEFIYSFRNQSPAARDQANVEEKEYLVYLPSIMLAFASRLLLKRTRFFLEHDRRYAILGMNGVGKTTLLDRIAAGDIYGFPKDLTCYYVQHEIVEEDAQLSVFDYMRRDIIQQIESAKPDSEKKVAIETIAANVAHALEEVGFTDDLSSKSVSSLSGGWRMRLAIARSLLYNAELLLLDEPTNHLDQKAVDWLCDYLIRLKDTTIVLVSHDYDFVGRVCTDVIHFVDQKLHFFSFGFEKFQELNPDVVAALPKKQNDAENNSQSALTMLEAAANGDEEAAQVVKNIKPILFPEGCKLSGVANRGSPIASLKAVTFAYSGTKKKVVEDVSVVATLNSRVAILGINGAGKTTLLKLLVGELELDKMNGIDQGEVWKHHNLRIAYIAQHSMYHLDESIELTPCQYIQKRFWEGSDKEASKLMTTKLSEADYATMKETGEIVEIVSRVVRSKKLYYEVVKNSKSNTGSRHRREMPSQDFRSLDELKRLAVDRPHIMKLVHLYDEKLKVIESGVDLRPLTTPELIKHLKDFGVPSDIAQRKIRWMSGGQKSRLCLAAAAWTRPHMIILDEPTNYLDNESLAALTLALKTFRGAVLLISHHPGFVKSVAKQTWVLDGGKLSIHDASVATGHSA